MPEKAVFCISADSRYVLYLNARRLGKGPARCFPEHQCLDSYEVTELLRAGDNTIAVLINHFKDANFQYISGKGGLFAGMELTFPGRQKKIIKTDRSWKWKECGSFIRLVPRISVQQAFEEQFDAGREIQNWNKINFNDNSWGKADFVKSPPWKLEPREVRFLTEEPVFPSKLIRGEKIRSFRYLRTIFLTPNLFPGNSGAEYFFLHGYLYTNIYAVKPEIIQLKVFWPVKRLKVNGIETNDISRLQLKQGWNPVLMDISTPGHDAYLSMAIDSDQDLEFSPYKKTGSMEWLTIGNFALDLKKNRPRTIKFSAEWGKTDLTAIFDEKVFKKIWEREFDTGKLPGKYAKPVREEDLLKNDVYLRTVTDYAVPGKVKVENAGAICSASSDETIIHPCRDGDTRILIDFGREIVGYTEFGIDAEAGVVIDFNFFEAIEDGKIHFTHLVQPMHNSLRYITCKGRQEYISFCRRGFRYVFMTFRNFRKPVKIRKIRCLLNTYPVEHKGQFLCPDERLNRIWKVGKDTVLLCMEDTYVDCPAYEQTLWVGDARGEALSDYVAFGAWDLSRHCLNLVAQSLEYNVLPESHVPSGWRSIIPVWSFLWMWAIYEYYQYTGDITGIRKLYPAVKTTVKHLEQLTGERGLLCIAAWNLIDWANVDSPNGEVAHNDFTAVLALKRSAELAEVLGYKSDAEHFRKFAENIKLSANRHYWSDKAEAYVDCLRINGEQSRSISQQANTMAYLCECADGERIEKAYRLVCNAPEGVVRVGSPFFMFFTLEAMAKKGDFEKALDLIRERWSEMLEKDATTFWETFPGWEKEWWTRSHCHGWSAGPTYFLSSFILGIRPSVPGYSKVLIAPKPSGLKWCRGVVPTVKGEIKLAWKMRVDDILEVEVDLPTGITPEFDLPESAVVKLNGKNIKVQGR